MQSFRKCRVVWEVHFLFVGFFFPCVRTGTSFNHGELGLVPVSLACEDVAGLLKRTKGEDLNTVLEVERCLRAQPDEVDTGIDSCQGWTLVTQTSILCKTQSAAILFVKWAGKHCEQSGGSDKAVEFLPNSQSWGSGKESWVRD